MSSAAERNEAMFAALISGYATQAMVGLGKIASPITGKSTAAPSICLSVRAERNRTGMMVMAARTGAPIIPCRVSGTSDALPVKGRFIKPATISVSYGKPIQFDPDEIDLDDREKLMRQSEIVLDAIMSLPGRFPKNAEMTEEEWWSERRKSKSGK